MNKKKRWRDDADTCDYILVGEVIRCSFFFRSVLMLLALLNLWEISKFYENNVNEVAASS